MNYETQQKNKNPQTTSIILNKIHLGFVWGGKGDETEIFMQCVSQKNFKKMKIYCVFVQNKKNKKIWVKNGIKT